MLVICEFCGKRFNKPPFYIQRTSRHFCSKYCWDVMQVIETFLSGERVVKNCVMCGYEFSIAASNDARFSTCSDFCYRAHKAKENNGNWRGGVTNERQAAMESREYTIWRREVFVRDDGTCQMCGTNEGRLEADHIKPWAYFPDLRYDVKNGRVLCVVCHRTLMKTVFTYRPRKDETNEQQGMVRGGPLTVH